MEETTWKERIDERIVLWGDEKDGMLRVFGRGRHPNMREDQTLSIALADMLFSTDAKERSFILEKLKKRAIRELQEALRELDAPAMHQELNEHMKAIEERAFPHWRRENCPPLKEIDHRIFEELRRVADSPGFFYPFLPTPLTPEEQDFFARLQNEWQSWMAYNEVVSDWQFTPLYPWIKEHRKWMREYKPF